MKARVRTATLVLVRHGETIFNRAGQFRGRADPALTEKGQEQASRVADAIMKRLPAALYASPRLRAQMTAAQVGGRTGLRVEIDPRLDDLDYGEWTGLTAEDARTKWPSLFETWLGQPESVRFPGGESMLEASSRIEVLLSALSQRHVGSSAVLVTHDAVIRILLCRVLSSPLAAMHRIRIDLTSVSVIESAGDERLVTAVNHLNHFEKESRIG